VAAVNDGDVLVLAVAAVVLALLLIALLFRRLGVLERISRRL